MDVTCAKCSEPWDTYHMRHDEIWETSLSDEVKENWDGKLTEEIYAAFKEGGWKFAGSIYAIIQCPGCKNDDNNKTENFHERAEARALIADLMGDDEDATASMIEDLKYYDSNLG